MNATRHHHRYQYHQAINRRTIDDEETLTATRSKISRTDLGLALLSRRCKPGEPLTIEDIAVWAGCTRSNIHFIEQTALRKVRKALYGKPELAELLDHFVSNLTDRAPARRVTTINPQP